MVAGAVLPIAWHNGQWYLLFGRGGSDGKWSDFGGRCDDYNPLEPRRRRIFRVLETAARECMEETAGFLGDARSVLRDLVDYGARYYAEGAEARRRPRASSECGGGGRIMDDDQDEADEADDVEAVIAAALDQSLLDPRERKVRAAYDSKRADTCVMDRCRSAVRQMGMKQIWRPAFDAGADPTADWDCVEVGAYVVFLYPIALDARLPCAFAANRDLVSSSMTAATTTDGGGGKTVFEKSELRWFTIPQALAVRADFRPFYQKVLEIVVCRLQQQL